MAEQLHRLETKEERDQADCTVAFCRCGAAVIMAVTAGMSTETKRAFGDAAAGGCTIRHMPAEECRRQEYGCKCEQEHPQHAIAF